MNIGIDGMAELPEGDVTQLLNSWHLSDLKAKFKANYIVMEALKYLTEDDIIELIPKIGQRAIFRGRLLHWREHHGIAPPLQLKSHKLGQASATTTNQKYDEQNRSTPTIDHKILGTQKKCAQKRNTTLKPTMQSKVKQFYISPVVESPTLPTTAPPASPPVPKPHIAPFVTSIIKVETNCEKKNAKSPLSNAKRNVNKTTILQRISNSENNLETPKEIQKLEENQLDARHLYPIVKLETEYVDANWTGYNEPEPQTKSDSDPDEVQFMSDSRSIANEYIEYVDSDSTPEFDSENDNALYPQVQIAAKRIRPRKRSIPVKEKLDVRNILTNSFQGRQVLEFYEVHEFLDLEQRRKLIDTIAKDCWSTGRHIRPSDCCDVAKEIIEIFPNEKIEDYYDAKSGKTPKCPLYYKCRRTFLNKSLSDPKRRKRHPAHKR